MSLNVKGILEKTFQRSFKGYNEDEVDQFLDQVIDEMKSLGNEIVSLRSENAELAKELKAEKKHGETIRETEETIMHTLVSAQKSSERILHEAARKAELIIDSAETTARQRAEQMERDLEGTHGKLADLRNDATVFAAEFTSLINTTAAAFSEKYAETFGDGAGGGINAAALDKINKEVSESLKDIDVSEDVVTDQADAINEAQAEPMADDDDIMMTLAYEAEAVEAPVEAVEASVEAVEAPAEAVEAPTEAVEAPTEAVEAPVEAVEAPVEAVVENGSQKGMMELHEINQALNEMEQGEDILPDNIVEASATKGEAPPPLVDYKQKYNDYSWLYESDGQPNKDDAVSIKDPENKEELKSLIDEIID